MSEVYNFTRNVKIKLGFLLIFIVKYFSLRITKVGIFKWLVKTEYYAIIPYR